MVYMIIDVDLDHLAEVVFVNFLQFRITLCSLPYCGLQEVIMHSQLLRSEELCFPPLGWLIRIQYLEFNCVEALFYFLHLLIWSFLNTCLESWRLLLYFKLESIPNLLCYSNCSTIGDREFFQWAYLSFWYALINVLYWFTIEHIFNFWPCKMLQTHHVLFLPHS